MSREGGPDRGEGAAPGSSVESIRYVLERVEAAVKLPHAHLPEEIQIKRAALVAEERRIANYIGFIGEGKGTRALGEALKAAEQKALALRAELQAYEASEKAVFKVPPVEWIADRLMALQPCSRPNPQNPHWYSGGC